MPRSTWKHHGADHVEVTVQVADRPSALSSLARLGAMLCQFIGAAIVVTGEPAGFAVMIVGLAVFWGAGDGEGVRPLTLTLRGGEIRVDDRVARQVELHGEVLRVEEARWVLQVTPGDRKRLAEALAACAAWREARRAPPEAVPTELSALTRAAGRRERE